MFPFLHSLAIFGIDFFKSPRRLEAENLFLGDHVSSALRRAPPRLRLRGSDRALLVWMTRLWPSLLGAAQVVQPETILRWSVHEVRAGHQRPDRQDARPHRARQAAGGRRRGDRMKRREFIALLGGAAATWPLAARAQQPGRTYRLAFLANSGRQSPIIAAFFDELSLNGFVEGQNLNVVVDGFEIRDDQIDRLVGEVIKAAPDVVLSPEQPARVLQ